ncbi:4Fe-4S dicluster domain-containing protein [Prolixibacteraceae bacterium JC049]|nr:4Fe-4S dicluster domain-containing protein [Prolixibacteraceae bacterium JC049]
MDRRKALAVGGFLSLALINRTTGKDKKCGKYDEFRQVAIIPPGGQSKEHFLQKCTACYACVSACPSKVLRPSTLEHGWSGIFMPHLTNKDGYCNFECVKCSEVCPNGALLPLKVEEKKELQLGIAKFVRERCVVITDKTECGACSEHCPVKAVNMVVEDGLRVPIVEEAICVGCGACEYACPVLPLKAIYIEGHDAHQVALKPKVEKLPEVNIEEDFPF